MNGVEVLVNPLSSLKYVIQELTLNNIISGDATDTGATSANAFSEGKMTILEPRGIRFFNHIYDTYRQLGATTGGKTAVWMIKTIFIGHKNVPQDGSVEYITNIKPMLVQPVEMTAEFTEAGGRYDIAFVMQTAGSGHMRSSNSNALTVGSTVNLSGSSNKVGTVTLQQALQSLEQRIRVNYEKSYAKERETTGNEPDKVDFHINLADRLKDSSYIVEVPAHLSSGGNGSVPIYAGSPNERLDQTIGNILKWCPKLVKESTEGDGSGRWIPKLVSTSTVADPTQNGGYRTIEEFNIVSSQLYSVTNPTKAAGDTTETLTPQGTVNNVSPSGNASASATKEDAMIAGNFMEFDYVYTGKNVDVLSYDMKMNYAIAFFERLTATAAASSKGQIPATQHLRAANSQPTVGDPSSAPMVAPNVSVSGASVHSNSPQDTAQYEQILKQQLAVETVAVNMKIRGNPLLLDNLITSRSDVIAALAGGQPKPGVAANWLIGPIVVRVNVMMPVDDTTQQFESFWYDGFYRILSVRHNFSGGQFTQDLEMVALGDDSRPILPDSTAARAKAAQPGEESTSEILNQAIPEPVGDRVPIRTLSISSTGIELIKELEGWKATEYLDSAGKPTIGYGHLITPREQSTGQIIIDGAPVIFSGGLTPKQGEALLRTDVAAAEASVKRSITSNLYQREYDALVSFTFNLGGGNLSESTLRTVVNKQQYTAAPDQFRQWNKETVNGVKVVNPGLVNRRNAEINMWGTSS